MTVATLLTYGANPNLGYYPSKGSIPEGKVADSKDTGLVKWKGLKLGQVNPLELALYRANRTVVQLLLAAGADPDMMKRTITVGKKYIIFNTAGLRKIKTAASAIQRNKHKFARTTRIKAQRRKSASGSDDGDDDERNMIAIATAAAVGITLLGDDVSKTCTTEEEDRGSGSHTECIDFSALAISSSLDDYGIRSSEFTSACSSSSDGYSSGGGWGSSGDRDNDYGTSSGFFSCDSGGHSGSSSCGGGGGGSSSACGSSCGGGGGCGGGGCGGD